MKLISPQAYWFHEGYTPVSRFEPLHGDLTVDVAIVGAGITGLTAANYLAQAGKRVAVVDAGQIGAGTTGGTSGHLDSHPDHGFQTLVNKFGSKSAAQICEIRGEAIDTIERWSRELNCDCDFRRVAGYLFAENQQQREQLVEEYEAAKECGIHALLTTDVPLPCHSEAAIRLEQQGRFHVMKYLQGLADHVHGGNGAIYEHTRVLEPPEGGSPCMVSTDRGVIRASDVILATHSPFLGVSVMDARVAPYQSYVLTVELEEPIADALYWDLDSPYHYLRQASSSEPNVWIIGGADHKTGQADERQCYAALEQYARGRFRVRKVRQRWSAELFESSDGAPFIGQVPLQKHLYLATGFSGTGLTWGTVAGRLLASQILDQPHPLSETLAPSRLKPLAAAGDLVKENMNVVKRFVTDRYKAETAEELHEAELEPGEGRVLKHDGELIAVCKDAAGDLHACTATCTHAGCAVQWNRAEQTWDCPCHGGRYDSLGRRIYGPPPSDLKIRNVQEIIRSSSTTS